MAKQFWDYATSYKVFLIRVFFYTLMPSLTAYLAIAQTIDLDSKYPSMGLFERISLWLGIAMPGLTSFVALLDKSRELASQNYREKRSGMTSFFSKPTDTGP